MEYFPSVYGCHIPSTTSSEDNDDDDEDRRGRRFHDRHNLNGKHDEGRGNDEASLGDDFGDDRGRVACFGHDNARHDDLQPHTRRYTEQDAEQFSFFTLQVL